MIKCDILEWKQISAGCFLLMFMYVLPLEIQLLKQKGGWDPIINRINSSTCMCLSQGMLHARFMCNDV